MLRNELREVEALIRAVPGEDQPTIEVAFIPTAMCVCVCDGLQALDLLQKHRRSLQQDLKCAHNQNFGSIFRTHNRPTLYMEQMMRYANIYSSQVTNLLHYPVDAKLYPPRVRLPHEKSSVLKYHGEFLREF